MNAFIDAHRAVHGVEPICEVWPIAPSTYRRYAARQADPTRRSARAQRDEHLCAPIQRVWEDHVQVYGADKVWRQLQREGVEVARCTVERADAATRPERRAAGQAGQNHGQQPGSRPS